MNPASSAPGGSSLWQEARNADGRVYYYNVQTKVTQWAKPAELLTPVEVSFNNHRMVFYANYANRTLTIARSFESAMEGIYCRRRKEILVQH